jgi:hypothetical protein
VSVHSLLDTAGEAAATAGGRLLRTATGLVAARPAAKPLHPRGSVVRGVLRRSGAAGRTGAAWLDRPGEDEVLVRRSRAVGLPGPVPDIHGVAIRVPTDDGYGDLLFATTGLGRVSRFVLTAARTPHGRPMTTLLPYRTPAGPVLLSAVFRDEGTLGLAWALGAGTWQPFAELSLAEDPLEGPDAQVSFDPVHNMLPGLANYAWVSRLREPSYAGARQSRRR